MSEAACGSGVGTDGRPLPLGWGLSLSDVGSTFLWPLPVPGPRLAGLAACFQLLEAGLCPSLLSLCEAIAVPLEQEPALDPGNPGLLSTLLQEALPPVPSNLSAVC